VPVGVVLTSNSRPSARHQPKLREMDTEPMCHVVARGTAYALKMILEWFLVVLQQTAAFGSVLQN